MTTAKSVRATEKLVSDFKRVSGGQNYYETWNALISSMAAFIATASMNDCQWLSERAEAAMNGIPENTRDGMGELQDSMVEAFEAEPFQDLLGDAYMRIGIGSKDNGQFFTPYHLSKAMSDLSMEMGTVKRNISERGYTTVNDPAAGGGANLIAAAHTLKENGINYQKHALFVAQELSELTALTCYVQMSLLGMPGIVQIGDTLRIDYRFTLLTPMLTLDETWVLRRAARLVFG